MDDVLASELVEMGRRDQAAVRAVVAALPRIRAENPWLTGNENVQSLDTNLAPELQALHDTVEANVASLKEIVDRVGWPGVSLVGQRASDAAFLLVQHARDVEHDEFRRRCFEAMREALDRDDVLPRHYAMLSDDLARADGRRPPYASGVAFSSEGDWIPPVDLDIDAVDAARAEIGMPPLRTTIPLARVHLRLRARLPRIKDAEPHDGAQAPVVLILERDLLGDRFGRDVGWARVELHGKTAEDVRLALLAEGVDPGAVLQGRELVSAGGTRNDDLHLRVVRAIIRVYADESDLEFLARRTPFEAGSPSP